MDDLGNRRNGGGGALARRWLAVMAAACLAAASSASLASGSGEPCPRTDVALQSRLDLRRAAQGLKLDDGLQILAIGSSSTEGVGASSPANAYPAQLERTLADELPAAPVEVRNAGVGGETVELTVARLEKVLSADKRPDLVIWQVGTNDAIRDGDEAAFEALLQRGVAAVRRAGSQLIMLDQQFYPSIPDLARYGRYVGKIGSAAAAAKVGLFSRYAMMRQWSSAKPGLLPSMLADDQFHMSDRGYRCLAEALGREIAWVVQPAEAPIGDRRGAPVLRTARAGN